jgi:hypothetical protein
VARVTPPCASPADEELPDAEPDADEDDPDADPDADDAEPEVPEDDPDVPDEDDPDDEPEVEDPDDEAPDGDELVPPDDDDPGVELPVPELEHADTARAITLSAMAPVMVLRNISDLSVVVGRHWRVPRGSRRRCRGRGRSEVRWPAVVLSAGARKRRSWFVSFTDRRSPAATGVGLRRALGVGR